MNAPLARPTAETFSLKRRSDSGGTPAMNYWGCKSEYGVLTDVLHLRFPRARTEAGLITRLVATCAALNLGIYVNRRYGRPDLAHGTLFRG